MRTVLEAAALVLLLVQAPANAAEIVLSPDVDLSAAFKEEKCTVRHRETPCVLRVYHSQVREAEGGYRSVAIVCLKKDEFLVPIHVFQYLADHPNMFRVSPYDLDDDGMSEFVIEKFSAGATHTYRQVLVVGLAFADDDRTILEDQRFAVNLEDSLEDLRVEAIGDKGRYRIIIGSKVFQLYRGQGVDSEKK